MKKLFLILLLLPAFCYGDIVLNREQIQQIPVETLAELLRTQPGIIVLEDEIHVDGYDKMDLLFLLDGSSISYSTALSIDLSMIDKLEIITSQAGRETTEIYPVVIKIHTLPNLDKFHLNIASLIEKSWYKNKLNLYANIPILHNLYISSFVTFDRNDTRFRKYYKNDPVEDLQYLTVPEFSANDPYKNRSDLDDRNLNNTNYFYKLTYDFTLKSHLTYSHSINNRYETPFDHDWKYALEHYKEIEQNENVWNVNFQQELNDKFKFNIGMDYNTLDYKENPQGIGMNDYFTLDPDNFDPLAENDRYECTGINYLTEENGLIGEESIYNWSIMSDGQEKFVIDFVRPGTILRDYINNSYESMKFHLDADYKFNDNHTFSARVNYQDFKIKKYQDSSPWVINYSRYNEYLNENATQIDSVYNSQTQNWDPRYSLEDIYDATLSASGMTDGFEAKPKLFSFNIQDKIEYGKLSGVIGLKSIHQNLGKEYKSYRNGGIVNIEEFNPDDQKQQILCPYLSIHYTLLPDLNLRMHHMMYGHSSFPNFDKLYFNNFADFETFEYYSYGVMKSFNFDLQLDFEYKHHVSKYQYVTYEGMYEEYPEYHIGYLTSNSYNFAATYSAIPDLALSTNFSITNFNEHSSIDWKIKHNFDFKVNYKTYYDINVGALFSMESGKSYIPTNQEGSPTSLKSKYMKPTQLLNLKLSKEFQLGRYQKLAVYILAKNVLDRKEELYIYPYTGSPYYDGADISEPNSNYTALEVQHVHDEYTRNPANVSDGRTLIVGMEYKW